MSEAFLDLSRDDRLEALRVPASRSGRAIHLLEKDIWVVWALREGDAERAVIDYDEAVMGGLRLVPEGTAAAALAADYAAMVDDGLMFEEPPSFAGLIESCRSIQAHANAAAKK